MMREKFVQILLKLLFWDFPKYEPEKQEIELTGYAKELETAYHEYVLKSIEKDNRREK